jgi:hypothetical protein
MAKKRRIGRFTLKEDRRLIRMAATSATPEKAAAIFRTFGRHDREDLQKARHPIGTRRSRAGTESEEVRAAKLNEPDALREGASCVKGENAR